MKAIHRQHLKFQKTHAGKGQRNDWHVAKNKNFKSKTSKVYKIGQDKGGVLKFKDILNPGPKKSTELNWSGG